MRTPHPDPPPQGGREHELGGGNVFPRSFQLSCLIAAAAWCVFGVLLNPGFADTTSQTNALLAGEAVLGIGAVLVVLFRAARLDDSPYAPPPPPPAPSWLVWPVLLSIALGCLFLERWGLLIPRLLPDDRMCLADARTWEQTRSHLLVPFNEHLIAPGRIWAYVALQTGSDQTVVYRLLAGMWAMYLVFIVQLFLLARREFGGDAAALAAAAGFSLTYVHDECFWWFMGGGQWWWVLNLELFVLLVLDPSRPSWRRAAIAAVTAFLSPFALSIGAAVGASAALWIWCRWPSRRFAAWLPLAGSILGVAAVAPFIAKGLRPEQLETATVKIKWFSFDLWGGLGCSVRLAADHLVLRNLGLSPGGWPAWLAAVVFAAAIAALVAVVARRPACWRLAPFLSLILLTYGIIVPFRSWMDYPQMTKWTARYQSLPHLGLVCFVVGAVVEFRRRRVGVEEPFRPLSPASAWKLLALAAALVVLHESTHGGWRWGAAGG